MNKIIRLAITVLFICIIILSGCNKLQSGNPQENTNNPPKNINQIESLVKSHKEVKLADFRYQRIEVPKNYPSIASLAGSGDTLFFSSGTDKPSKNTAPCLTYIEKLFSYNMKTKVLTNIAEIDSGFVQIDWVDANEDWVVYREISEEFGGPERIYAINRKNNSKELIFESGDKGCANCGGVLSSHPFALVLWKDSLVMASSSFEGTKYDKNGKIIDGSFLSTVALINLITKESKTIFSKSAPLKSSAAIFSMSVNSSYLAFNYAEDGSQTIYLYSFNNGTMKELLNVPLMSTAIGTNDFLNTNVLLTEDNYIIFDYPENLKADSFMTVIAPLENIKEMKSLFKEVPTYYLTWPQVELKDYIVWADRKEDTLYILNRNTGSLNTIVIGIGYLWVSNDNIFAEGGIKDDVFLMSFSLKENGF